jgi:hypothetical protein
VGAGAGGIWRQRERASLPQVLLKPMITYGKGGTSEEGHGWFPAR